MGATKKKGPLLWVCSIGIIKMRIVDPGLFRSWFIKGSKKITSQSRFISSFNDHDPRNRVPKGFRAPGLQDENFRALRLHIICFRAPGSTASGLHNFSKMVGLPAPQQKSQGSGALRTPPLPKEYTLSLCPSGG